MFHVEHYGDLVAEQLAKHAAGTRLQLSAKHLEQIALYAGELALWNERMNLTTVREIQEVAIKHFLDSLIGGMELSDSDDSAEMVDIGSGAGFPGIPIKIIRPNVHLYLVEKNSKKSSFLANIVGKLKLTNVTVVNRSFQQASHDRGWQGKFEGVAVRAVNTETLLPLIQRVLARRGRAILYRSDELDKRKAPVGLRISRTVHYALPLGYGKRVLEVLEPS